MTVAKFGIKGGKFLNIGKRLKDARIESGYIQEQVAEQSAASTKDIDNIKNQSTEMVDKTNSSVEGGQKRNQKMEQKVAGVAEASDKIEEVQGKVLEGLESISASTQENAAGTEEVSANSEEVLATMDEFTQHVSDLRDISGQLKKETDNLTIER